MLHTDVVRWRFRQKWVHCCCRCGLLLSAPSFWLSVRLARPAFRVRWWWALGGRRLVAFVAFVLFFLALLALASAEVLRTSHIPEPTHHPWTRGRESPRFPDGCPREGMHGHSCPGHPNGYRFSGDPRTDLIKKLRAANNPALIGKGPQFPRIIADHQCAHTGAVFAPKRGESRKWCTLGGELAARITGALGAVAPRLQLGARSPDRGSGPKPRVNRARTLLDYRLY
jgi:hypothetical protein